jgi:geranylgeranyl diphosphate synthase type I
MEAARARMLHAYRDRHQSKGPSVGLLISALDHARSGGKKTRARLLWSSYMAHLADSPPPALSEYRLSLMAASLEMMQDAVLVHDDIVDHSDARRGQPSLYRVLQNRHREAGWLGDGEHSGMGLAMIAGDVVVLASERAFRYSVSQMEDPEQREYLESLYEWTVSEVMLGQFLDVMNPRLPEMPEPDELINQAIEVVRSKSARFNVSTPLGVGAAAAVSSRAECEAMVDCGMPLGEALQLREDQLSATGDPEITGKPAGVDLLEGRRTVLVGLTLKRLGEQERRSFVRALQRGDAPLGEERVHHLQHVIRSSGALEDLEQMINQRLGIAIEALERTNLSQAGKGLLTRAALAAAGRLT